MLLLEQQIAGVLPKVVEGSEEENEEESNEKHGQSVINSNRTPKDSRQINQPPKKQVNS